MEALPGRVLSGRYKLEGAIGKGGMGVVYRATDGLLDRTVAIKILAADLGESYRERFLREAKSTARVRHPGVVEVFDFGRTPEDELYLVMELLSGITLQRYIDDNPPHPTAEIVRVASEIADAIAAAHAAGVVHRDLKPQNILLDATGRATVLDFGIAKTLHGDARELTTEGSMIGTIEYMAPEQIRGDPVDGRADVYSFGCLLYRLITRRPPYQADTLPELVHRHLAAAPDPVTSPGEPAVPPSLEALVLDCLKKDREGRPTMAEVKARLANLDGARDVTAGPRLDLTPRSVPIPDLIPNLVRAPEARAAPVTAEFHVDHDAPIELHHERTFTAPPTSPAHVRACVRCGVRLERYARACQSCGHSDDPLLDRVLAPPVDPTPKSVPLQIVYGIPAAIHLRIFAGGLLTALINAIFFHNSLVVHGTAALVTLIGGLGIYLHRRQ